MKRKHPVPGPMGSIPFILEELPSDDDDDLLIRPNLSFKRPRTSSGQSEDSPTIADPSMLNNNASSVPKIPSTTRSISFMGQCGEGLATRVILYAQPAPGCTLSSSLLQLATISGTHFFLTPNGRLLLSGKGLENSQWQGVLGSWELYIGDNVEYARADPKWCLVSSSQAGFFEKTVVLTRNDAFNRAVNIAYQQPVAIAAVFTAAAGENTGLQTIARELSTSLDKISPILFSDFEEAKDIIFVFPNESSYDKISYIWANRAGLQKASPYWQQMFSGGYNEGESTLVKLSGWKVTLETELANIIEDYQSKTRASLVSLDDSDDESGQLASIAKIKGKGKAKSSSNDNGGISHVIVTDASVKTYKALLIWISTGCITFAPLSSSKQEGSVSSGFASPKSVYALVHKLDIEELQKRALTSFCGQLTEVNALQELFSSHAALYPELSAAAMTATIANLSKIKAAKGHLYLKQVVSEGKVDPRYAGEIVVELVGRL